MEDNYKNDWLFEIKPKDNLLRLNLKEVLAISRFVDVICKA